MRDWVLNRRTAQGSEFRRGSEARSRSDFCNTYGSNHGGTGSAYTAAVMSDIVSFRDLQCWQKAMDLAELVYGITGKFPRHERFGLTSHARKTAVSVPSNIAE